MRSMILTREAFAAEAEQIEFSRELMLDEHRLSAAPAVGKMVILVTGRGTKGFVKADYESFMGEAERWQAELKSGGEYSAVEIAEHAKAGTVLDALRNPDVAGLTFIGHGTLGEFWTENESRIVDWQIIARAVDHLKQGDIWQATCGHIPSDRGLVAPLATAAAGQLSKARGAPGIILPDTAINYHEFLRPIFDDSRPLLEQLIELNERFGGMKSIVDEHGRCVGTKPC